MNKKPPVSAAMLIQELVDEGKVGLCPDCLGESNSNTTIKCGTCGCSGLVLNVIGQNNQCIFVDNSERCLRNEGHPQDQHWFKNNGKIQWTDEMIGEIQPALEGELADHRMRYD